MHLMSPTDEKLVERLDAIDVRVEGVDRRFDVVDERFESVERRFDLVDERFESVERRFDGIDERFESVDRRFDEMDHKVDLAREEIVTVKDDMRGIKQEFGKMRESIDALHFMIHRGSLGVIVTMIGLIVTLLIKL